MLAEAIVPGRVQLTPKAETQLPSCMEGDWEGCGMDVS